MSIGYPLIRRTKIWYIMTHETVLAALPNSEAEAKSLKDIAQVIGLEISSHTDWIRAERRLARVLRILIKWGWAASDRRQRIYHRFWHNVYWKTDLAIQQEIAGRD
jgi:hypothetical protein